jgi:hypothetical protein
MSNINSIPFEIVVNDVLTFFKKSTEPLYFALQFNSIWDAHFLAVVVYAIPSNGCYDKELGTFHLETPFCWIMFCCQT